MNDQEKREAVEKALGQIWFGNRWQGLLGLARRTTSTEGREAWESELFAQLVDALAKEAIVVPVEIEHAPGSFVGRGPFTVVRVSDDMGIQLSLYYTGHCGQPGEAWAIMVPKQSEIK